MDKPTKLPKFALVLRNLQETTRGHKHFPPAEPTETHQPSPKIQTHQTPHFPPQPLKRPVPRHQPLGDTLGTTALLQHLFGHRPHTQPGRQVHPLSPSWLVLSQSVFENLSGPRVCCFCLRRQPEVRVLKNNCPAPGTWFRERTNLFEGELALPLISPLLAIHGCSAANRDPLVAMFCQQPGHWLKSSKAG